MRIITACVTRLLYALVTAHCPQLLRGLATGMKVPEFSAAAQWKPYARQAARQLRGTQLPLPPTASLSAHVYALRA